MLQMAHRRRIRTVIAAGIFTLLAAIAFLIGGRFFTNTYLFAAGLILLFIAEIMFAALIWFEVRRHHGEKGMEYARLHRSIEKAVNQALYDAGFYVEREVLLRKCALLPKLDIILNESLSEGTITIENRIKHDSRLDDLPISSALPDEFVPVASFLSDDGNEYIFHFERFKIENLVFDSFKEYRAHIKEVGTYDLFLNDRHVFPMFHILLIGQTGSGKSYGLYAIILQMVSKEKPWEIFLVDPKYSGLYVLGTIICRDRVAYTTDDSIELLKAFSDRMQERKQEMEENLLQRIDSDYRDFRLPPICMVIDEYSAFNASLSRYDKKTRDEVTEIIGNIVREGRQLGCFLILAQQQTNATNLSTELKENIPCKIILGIAERQTYITALGIYPDVAKRHFGVGQGLLTYPGIASPETPAVTTMPTLRFDILDAAAQAACYKASSGGDVITPAPTGEIDA